MEVALDYFEDAKCTTPKHLSKVVSLGPSYAASAVGRRRASGDGEFPVIVAMPPVCVVQVPGNEVIDVIAVWHRWVPATGAMLVGLVVRTASV